MPDADEWARVRCKKYLTQLDINKYDIAFEGWGTERINELTKGQLAEVLPRSPIASSGNESNSERELSSTKSAKV